MNTRVNTRVSRAPTSSAPYWVEDLGSGRHSRFRAKIGGLHCSLCTGTIEKALGRLQGVSKVAVSLTHEQTLVEYDPARVQPQELLATLKDIGYTIWDPRKARPYEEEEADLVREGKRLLGAIGFSLMTIALILEMAGIWFLLVPLVTGISLAVLAFLILRSAGLAPAVIGTAALGLVTTGGLLVKFLGVAHSAVPWMVGLFAVVVVFGLAQHILLMAVQSIRRGILNQHVLLEFGAFAGLAGGLIGLILRPAGYPTAAFFAVSVLIVNYHLFSEWLSLLVKTRSSQAVKRLLDLQPDTARVVRDGREVEVGIDAVVVGDLVRVRPGERVPVDGEVVEGHSAVDQSLVTGEPVPVEKLPGESVVGGSINGLGTFLVRVTAVGDASFLQQVIQHVEDARALKPGILHLVDRILVVYAPAVLVLEALSFIGWTAGAWLVTGHADLPRAVFAGLSVLVMGYPCAVGIAAPLSIVRGAGTAADQGIIMRTGEAFQAFGSVNRIVLDKTGTLTLGRPVVQEVVALGSADELLALAADAEASSEHPLGQAILNVVVDKNLRIPQVEDFESVTGCGVSALIEGARVRVGQPGYLEENGVDVSPLKARMAELEGAGQTVVAVSRERQLLGVIALGDQLRGDAAEAVGAMQTVTRRVSGPDWRRCRSGWESSAGVAALVHRGTRGSIRPSGCAGADRRQSVSPPPAGSGRRTSAAGAPDRITPGRGIWAERPSLCHTAAGSAGGAQPAPGGGWRFSPDVCVRCGHVRALAWPGRLAWLAAGPATAERPATLCVISGRWSAAPDWDLRHRQRLAPTFFEQNFTHAGIEGFHGRAPQTGGGAGGWCPQALGSPHWRPAC